MPRTGERGGPQTRARIAEVAAGMFIERGFDAVTVAEVAKRAGVSSVTVFTHFPRKEDLYLDRRFEAVEQVGTAARERVGGDDAVAALRRMCVGLAEAGHPLSGLAEGSVPFFRTVAGSPRLLERSREIAADVVQALAGELARDPASAGDATLLAALFVAGYATVLVETARRRLAGDPLDAVTADHRARLERLFDALRGGVVTRS